MKAQQVQIGNRYLYTPSDPIAQNKQYAQYRVYDKLTKRDLFLQIIEKQDEVINKLRQHKHPFILFLFDIVQMDDGRLAYLFQTGVLANLGQVMEKCGYMQQQDALVIFKYILLMTKQLHEKLIVANRMCLQNILLCNYALIKFGHNTLRDMLPLQYQSPQMLQGQKTSYSSDIYSLGVILYRLVYGQFPFKASDASQIKKKIKSKNFTTQQIKSPLNIAVSRQVHFLILSMLDYYQQNRPTLEMILNNSSLSFPIDTQLTAYMKPKGAIVPEPFHKKYMVYRPTKLITKFGDYYSQSAYLVLNIKQKNFMTLYAPQVRMFEAQPRKVQSYFQKLRAIQNNYNPATCQFLVKVDDVQRFRQQPVFVTEYCNQGNLLTYLQKRKIFKGWLSEKQVNVIMYILAVGLKQMKTLGITSVHTINSQRIMINNNNIKIRQPGLLSPIIQKRLQQNHDIDYFAPELKQKLDFVELDKSDIWSYGMLYYYLLTSQMPKCSQENAIDLSILKTSKKNINIIGKCLDYNVKRRMELDQMRMDNINEELLQQMLMQKKASSNVKAAQQERLIQGVQQNDQKLQQKQEIQSSQMDSNAQQLRENKKVMFKRRQKRLFKHYNKIICESTTSTCRLVIKSIIGLILLLILFFGRFFVNGGTGLLRTDFYRSITLYVPYNYGTSLINMTILAINGGDISSNFRDFSYQQFTIDLRCSPDTNGSLYNFVNGTHTVYSLFGFIFLILICVLYVITTFKLDLPTLMQKRKQKKQNNQLYHFMFMHLMMPSLLFTFFYIYALDYIIQKTPCFGIQNLAYPTFTSVDAIINNESGKFLLNVFLTCGLWAIGMIGFGFTSFFVKKVIVNIYEWISIVPSFGFLLIMTIICRVGFGGPTPIQPTWTYKMNTDITSQYYGLFGFFPQIVWIFIFVSDRVIDFVFWFFLKLGLQPDQQQDITKVEVIKAKFQKLDTKEKDLGNEKSNIYMIQNAYDFQRFD